MTGELVAPTMELVRHGVDGGCSSSVHTEKQGNVILMHQEVSYDSTAPTVILPSGHKII